MSTIACIGSGNMGFALMNSQKNKTDNSGKKTEIYITDADKEKAQTAAILLNAKVLSSNIEAAQKSDIVFLAVKPQILSEVLAEIAPIIKKRYSTDSAPVLVSMAAGWSTGRIQTTIEEKIPVVRIMPNTPSLIGKGMIAMSASPEVTADKITELEIFLGCAGKVDIIEEQFLDAVTGLSGSGPAFVYMFIDALADGGVKAGLSREKALCYAIQTVFGAAAMVQETGKQPEELINMVTSPGGTTLAGLAALKDNAFGNTVIKAVEAAWKRSIELGK